MEHESSHCLNHWVAQAAGWEHSHGNIYRLFDEGWQLLPHFSGDVGSAYRLMEWVWEREPHAHIHRDRIELEYERTPLGSVTVRIIRGPTFPLRACRAALWLALTQQSAEKR